MQLFERLVSLTILNCVLVDLLEIRVLALVLGNS